MKQIYKITYPTGKIYIGKDSIGSHRYMGSPDMDTVNADFALLALEVRRSYSVHKEILWESETASEAELAAKEVEFIRKYHSMAQGEQAGLIIQHITKDDNGASTVPAS